MPLDAPGLRAVFAENSVEVFLWLVEITHPQLEFPLRLTNNTEAISSRGRLFYPARMRVAMPEQVEGRQARARIVLEDVTEAIRYRLRQLSPQDAPEMLNEFVLASNPDHAQRTVRLRMAGASWDAIAIEAELMPRAPRATPWAAYTPDLAPAVHRFSRSR